MTDSHLEQLDSRWTLCTSRCTHRAPYRVHYRSGHTALITNDGCAQANWALFDSVIVAKVTAPHADTQRGGPNG